MVKQPRASGFISVLVAVLMNQCIMMKRICEGAKAASCFTHFNVLVMFSLTDVTKYFTKKCFVIDRILFIMPHYLNADYSVLLKIEHVAILLNLKPFMNLPKILKLQRALGYRINRNPPHNLKMNQHQF